MLSISQKIKKELLKGRNSKIIDIEAIQEGASLAKEVLTYSSKNKKISESIDPLNKLYFEITNYLGGIVEIFNGLNAFRKVANKMQKGRDDYMPSYPPMSPISKSYYVAWELYDMQLGIEKETLASIILDTLSLHKDVVNVELIKIIKYITQTKMGIFEVCEKNKKLILLKELISEEEFWAISSSGYEGAVGQLWYARRMPTIFGYYDYSVIVTTPYVLLNDKKDWIDFFNKHGVLKRNLYNFMKFGPKKNFWNEFIFYGYYNFIDQAIFLSGLPEHKKMLPCSSSFQGNRSEIMSRLMFEFHRTSY